MSRARPVPPRGRRQPLSQNLELFELHELLGRPVPGAASARALLAPPPLLPALPLIGLRTPLPRHGRPRAERRGPAGRLVLRERAHPAHAEPPPDDPPLRALQYAVVDVETTGGSAARGHRITEVAAVAVAHDGRVLEEYVSLVNPERPIPSFISSLTNITWDMVRDAPTFREIAEAVERILAGRVFVAHNAAFDWRFISFELERAGIPVPDARVLCTVKLARKVVPEVCSRSLDALTYYFGLENEARHRAFGDARVTAVLLRRLMSRLDDHEIVSWLALERLVGRRKPRKRQLRHATPTSMDPSEIPSQ